MTPKQLLDDYIAEVSAQIIDEIEWLKIAIESLEQDIKRSEQ